MIDTSSFRTRLALLDGDHVASERVAGRLGVEELPPAVTDLVGDVGRLTCVVITTGPGSFTGLRAGASYGIGLAQGLGIPLFGLGTFHLVRALSTVPARPVVEAGRGRVYLERDGGEAGIAELDALPRDLPIVGLLTDRVIDAAREAGVPTIPETAHRGFGRAALTALERAVPLPYGRVKLSYVTSVGSVRD